MPSATAHEEWLSTSAGHPGKPGDGAFTSHANGWRVSLEAAAGSFGEDAAKVLESRQLARLYGVKQAVPFPPPGLRSRGGHTDNVSSLACRIATDLGLNVDLAVAIARAHDCGHPPGAHSGEAALAEIIPGWDHAAYGATALAPLELHPLVVDGVVSHSWRLPSPVTAEAHVVAFADRAEYATADLWDASQLGLEWSVSERAWEYLGLTLSQWQESLCRDIARTSRRCGYVSVSPAGMAVLQELREECSRAVYTHPSVVSGSEEIARAVVTVFQAAPRGWPVKLTLGYVCGLTDAEALIFAKELRGA